MNIIYTHTDINEPCIVATFRSSVIVRAKKCFRSIQSLSIQLMVHSPPPAVMARSVFGTRIQNNVSRISQKRPAPSHAPHLIEQATFSPMLSAMIGPKDTSMPHLIALTRSFCTLFRMVISSPKTDASYYIIPSLLSIHVVITAFNINFGRPCRSLSLLSHVGDDMLMRSKGECSCSAG